MGRTKKEVEVAEVVSAEKEINLKQLYKFKFNSKAPNQTEGKIVEVTGELVKIYLKAGYGLLY